MEDPSPTCCGALLRRKVNEPDVEKLGLEMYNREDYEEAIRCYNVAIAKNPSEVSNYRMRGKSYLKLRKSDLAISDLKQVVNLLQEPHNTEDRILLCETLFNSGRSDEAVEELALLEEVKIVRLADRLFNKRQYEDAIRCYTEAIKKNSYNEKNYVQRAKCYVKMRNLDSAILDYTEALKINPDEVSYYEHRGNCHVKLQNFEMGISDFKTALSAAPNRRNCRRSLAEALFEAGRLDEAIAESVPLDDGGATLRKLGTRLYSSENLEEALRFFSEAINKGNTDYENHIIRGHCYRKMHNLDMAVHDYRRALLYAPDTQYSRYCLIKALLSAQRFEEAEKEMEYFNDYDIFSIAREMYHEGKFEQAICCCIEAIRKDPEKEKYYRLRGNCYLNTNQTDEAISDFKKTVFMDPHQLLNKYLLLDVLLDADRIGEALRGNDFPSNKEIYYWNDFELYMLGYQFYSKGKYEHAIFCCSDAIKKNPEYETGEYFHLRALGNWKLGNLESAILDMKRSLHIYPYTHEDWLDFAEILYEAERYDEAKKALEERNVLKLNVVRMEEIRRKIMEKEARKQPPSKEIP